MREKNKAQKLQYAKAGMVGLLYMLQHSLDTVRNTGEWYTVQTQSNGERGKGKSPPLSVNA